MIESYGGASVLGGGELGLTQGFPAVTRVETAALWASNSQFSGSSSAL